MSTPRERYEERLRKIDRDAARFTRWWVIWMSFCLAFGLSMVGLVIYAGYKVGAHFGVW